MIGLKRDRQAAAHRARRKVCRLRQGADCNRYFEIGQSQVDPLEAAEPESGLRSVPFPILLSLFRDFIQKVVLDRLLKRGWLPTAIAMEASAQWIFADILIHSGYSAAYRAGSVCRAWCAVVTDELLKVAADAKPGSIWTAAARLGKGQSTDIYSPEYTG